MKKSEITPTFVIICVAILIAAYGIGFCIYEIRLSKAEAAESKVLSKEIQDNKSANTDTEQVEDFYAQYTRNRQQNNRIDSFNSPRAQRAGRTGRTGRGGRGMQNIPAQDETQVQVNPDDFNDTSQEEFAGGPGGFGGGPGGFGGGPGGFGGGPGGFPGGPGGFRGGPGGFGGGPGGFAGDPGGFDPAASDDVGAPDNVGTFDDPGALFQQSNEEQVNYDN
jgi:hypothetical protein